MDDETRDNENHIAIYEPNMGLTLYYVYERWLTDDCKKDKYVTNKDLPVVKCFFSLAMALKYMASEVDRNVHIEYVVSRMLPIDIGENCDMEIVEKL